MVLHTYRHSTNFALLASAQTALTDRGVAEVVANLSSLASLYLSSTSITDEALKHVARLPNLTILSLEHTRVDDAGLAALRQCKNLETLRLTGSKVTQTGVALLRESLPNCDILWEPAPPLAIAPFDADQAQETSAGVGRLPGRAGRAGYRPG